MNLREDILPYRDRLYRLALSITLHTAEAEDIVQDTMLRAWQQREEWTQIQNVEAWLTHICRNLALDRKKKNAVQTVTQSLSNQEATVRSHHASLENSEAVTLLQQLIEQLPTPQNEIIRLRDIEGLSYAEIAEQTQLTENQVRVYLHRARTKIRKQYLQIQNFGL